VGHDISGPIALHVAANDPRVKAVTLLSSPGRPVVDVVADSFAATNGPAMADQFRSIVAGLVASGSLPAPDAIPAPLQSVLAQGQDGVLKGVFTVDPAAEAAKVKVPTLIVASSATGAIGRTDADRLAQAIGPNAQVLVTDSGTTLREIVPDRPPVAFDPNNDSTHVFGARIVDPVPRDQASVDKVAAFVATTLKPA
jgi:pimeloyl-ACP methyl ester carboxylesterase